MKVSAVANIVFCHELDVGRMSRVLGMTVVNSMTFFFFSSKKERIPVASLKERNLPWSKRLFNTSVSSLT